MNQAGQLLEALKSATITLDILHKTRIGATVNTLRKNIEDPELVTISKDLIKKWKKLLDKDEAKNKNGSNSPVVSSTVSKSPSSSKNGDSKTPNGPAKESSKASHEFKEPRPLSQAMDTSSEPRVKCRQLIAKALKTPFLEGQIDEDAAEDLKELDIDTLAENIAAQIEEHMFEEFKVTSPKYNQRARSRISNLSDKRNPDLRLNVLKGIIPPKQMAQMEASEMASMDMKNMREKITQEMIKEHQMAMSGGTHTDLIKCPKCKKSNCTYNQVQTRSADEPMTTFCFCNECGKRWKFC